MRNDLGETTTRRRWTVAARQCHERGCICEGCFYKDFFEKSSQKCQMKASVLELVRIIGKPPLHSSINKLTVDDFSD